MSLFTRSAWQVREEIEENEGIRFTSEFESMLNTWYSLPEFIDKDIERYIHETKLVKLYEEGEEFDSNRYFSPSSAGSCKRELFHKMRGDKRDQIEQQPHQGRWKKVGTLVGDMIQRDMLYIKEHYKKLTGKDPVAVPAFLPYSRSNKFNIEKVPAWEEFAKKKTEIEYKGMKIPIHGQPDGILEKLDGRRIGLEIKTKQTSPTKTGYFSMKEPDSSHKKQVTAYSLLYGIDEFVILYVNTSKYSWNMNEDTFTKYPDMRAFFVKITQDDREELLDHFVEVMHAVSINQPPKLDISKWTFNNYKEATINSLTMDEIHELEMMLDETIEKILQYKEDNPKKKTVPNHLQQRRNTLEDILTRVNLERGGVN